MDRMHGLDPDEAEAEFAGAGIEPAMEAPPAIGTDERRMHVRAYNHWVSLLAGRAYPAIADLHPRAIADFGPHGVLLDFTADPQNPAIAYLGDALRAECGLAHDPATIADVPPRSLLSRLTGEYQQIIVNRAPIGFEAEFVAQSGRNTLYRGILMPFSSDDRTIDHLYGVINWKELADADTVGRIATQMERDVRPAPAVAPQPWADGPSAAGIAPGGDAANDGALRAMLRRAAPLAQLDLPSAAGEFVLLIARRESDGRLAVLAPVEPDDSLLAAAVDRIMG